MQSLDGGGQDATGGGAAPASAAEWSGRRVEHASFDDFFVLLPDDLATTSAATAWGGRLKGAVLRATLGEYVSTGPASAPVRKLFGPEGIERIVFNIGDGGVQTIRPLSALPIIVEAVTIDGTTQPGYAGTPIVEIDGSQAGQTSGITLVGGSTIKGLVINRFADIAIAAEGGPDNPTTIIQGNYIGTDVTGIIALGNGQSGHTGGLLIGSNVILGGSNLQDRNIISGNYSAGIFLRGSNITVEGNYIGVGATGEPLGNQGFGIENSYDSPNNIIRNNLIASNTSTGISIRDRGGHLIENNIQRFRYPSGTKSER
jgi:hypothetical protein